MSERPTLSRFLVGLKAAVYGLAAFAFTWPIAQPGTAWVAAFACALGAALSGKVADSRLRALHIPLLGLLSALVGHGLVALLRRSHAVAEAFGSEAFVVLVDAMDFGWVAAVLGVCMASLAQRFRWFGVVEVLVGGLVASNLVAEHRHGAINRPFELADPILAAGGDPMLLFYALGGAAVLLLALVLIAERRWQRFAGHVLVLLLLLVAAGVAIQGGAVPRPTPEGGLGQGGDAKSGQGGKSDKKRPNHDMLEYRDQEPNREQQAPVAVVLLHDDYSPPSGVYYLRESAFSQYNGRRLVATTRDSLDRDALLQFPVGGELQVPDAPDATNERATIETTVALLADHSRPFGLEAPVSLRAAQNPSPERFQRVYTVVSSPITADYVSLLGHESGDPRWTPEERQQYLTGPQDPRFAELAQIIVADLPKEIAQDPMLRAWAVSEWLGKEVIYSLRSKHADADDPAADFLFGDRTGYCVHIAHAATYLLRALGVPSRIATGYAIDEASRQGGSAMLVPAGAAHAWPEVYLAGVGWVVVDVHPERTLDPAMQAPDADLQRLLGLLARGTKPLPPDASEPPPFWKDWLRAILARALSGIGAALFTVLLALYLAKVARRVWPRFTRGEAQARAVFRAELDKLAEVGITRQQGETHEAFADRARAALPALSPLTSLVVGARFGSVTASARIEGELVPLAAALSQERATTFPYWRRLVGILHPWSFLKVR
jgi:transglutaminase-like putative cysteine protease